MQRGEDGLLPTERVTDHVLIRWLERVEGIDLKPIKAAMVSDGYKCNDSNLINYIEMNSEFDFRALAVKISKIIDLPARAGCSTIRYGDHLIVLRDSRAISIIPRDTRIQRRNSVMKKQPDRSKKRRNPRGHEVDWV